MMGLLAWAWVFSLPGLVLTASGVPGAQKRAGYASLPGPIVLLVVGTGLFWALARPHGETARSYLGQLLGAESVLLLAIGLVLISTLPWVEEWFDGIDRAAIWHRRVAIAGLTLLLPLLGRRGAALRDRDSRDRRSPRDAPRPPL